MQSTSFYALIMLIAGVGIPVLATLNAALGQRLASPTAATVVLFSVALICALAAFAFSGARGLGGLSATPKHLMLGGVLIAFYLLSITAIAPKFGVGNAVFFVLLGQLISAAVIDHYGLFGAKVSMLSLSRTFGIALMAAGVFFTQQA